MEEKMKYWRVDMESNLYANVFDSYYIAAADEKSAKAQADELVEEFCNDYAYLHTGWIESEETYEGEFEELFNEFASEISYTLTEVSREEFEDNN